MLKGAPLHVIHHVVGRGRVPADGEELDDVAVGEQIAELFHLAGEQRPVEPGAAVEELDHHPTTAVAVDGPPGLAEGPLAQERLLLVPGDVEWRLEPRHAQLAGEPELVRPHHQGRVTDVRHARHPDRWRRRPGAPPFSASDIPDHRTIGGSPQGHTAGARTVRRLHEKNGILTYKTGILTYPDKLNIVGRSLLATGRSCPAMIALTVSNQRGRCVSFSP